MGKSPAKWIKTLLSGKKSSRSSGSKKSAKERELKNGFSAPDEDSPVISRSLPVEVGQPPKEFCYHSHSNVITTRLSREAEKGSTNFSQFECTDKDGEQAATKVQAAFRGYLARRAFRALWGIIRLQALFRGHLVRRQAVTTLHCILGIVRLQAIVRGRKARKSYIGLVNMKKVDGLWLTLQSQSAYLSSNMFISKLVSSAPVSKPLQVQYSEREPNSTWSWLERWSSIQFWKPPAVPKKSIDPKPRAQLSGFALETESGRLKRGVCRNYPSDNISRVASDSEKIKCNLRKISTATAEPVHEQPQSELEKVKHNLRKITSSYAQDNEAADSESERLKKTIKRISSSPADSSEVTLLSSIEKAKKDWNIQPPEASLDIENVQSYNLEVQNQHNVDTDRKASLDGKTEDATSVKLAKNVTVYAPAHLPQKDETLSPMNGHLEARSEETLTASKRRASFSAKSEGVENSLPKAPTLPSYMAATESAKAKRSQNSPRFGSDGIEKNGFVRRHSLPSSTNARLGQRADHPIRAEWRR